MFQILKSRFILFKFINSTFILRKCIKEIDKSLMSLRSWFHFSRKIKLSYFAEGKWLRLYTFNWKPAFLVGFPAPSFSTFIGILHLLSDSKKWHFSSIIASKIWPGYSVKWHFLKTSLNIKWVNLDLNIQTACSL